MDYIHQGNANRFTASTKMNAVCSLIVLMMN